MIPHLSSSPTQFAVVSNTATTSQPKWLPEETRHLGNHYPWEDALKEVMAALSQLSVKTSPMHVVIMPEVAGISLSALQP